MHEGDIFDADETEHGAHLLDGVPRHVPALAEAAQISSKAAGAGFGAYTPQAS